MDFYIMDQNEISKEIELKQDEVLKPFLTSVNFGNFEEYLKSAEYNDKLIRKFIGATLHQSPNATPIFTNDNNIKLR